MSILYDIFYLLCIEMTLILSKEQFQEKIESKRKNLLEQRTQRIADEIALILKWIDMDKLSEEEQLKIQESAKFLAEKKSYIEDYKLMVLENIKNSSEENHYWEHINDSEWINIFSDIENDLVYKRMVAKWDLENIKLFLERKLPIETYFTYLTDIEIKEIWNEDPILLKKQLEKEEEDSNANVEEQKESEENLGEDQISELIEQVIDGERWEDETKSEEIDEGNSNNAVDSWLGRELSDDDLFRINSAINYYKDKWMEINDCETIQDIIDKIKSKIFKRSWLTRHKRAKNDFLKNSNWIAVEEDDIPKDFKAWDKFNVYCAGALGWWYIEVKLQSVKEVKKIAEVTLPKYINIVWIKKNLRECFNSDMKAIKEFINKYFLLRMSCFITLCAKLPYYDWYSFDWYEQKRNELTERFQKERTKNPKIGKCSIYIGKGFVDKLFEDRSTTDDVLKLERHKALRNKLLEDE